MIRPYAADDLDDVLDVWYQASLVAHPFLSEEFLANERRLIAEQWLPVAETVVYETGGRVVGFLALVANEVGGIFVDPNYQAQGIGRTLMDQACGSHPVVELDVFEANITGRRFYDAYGFELVGRHMNEIADQPELRLRFERGRPGKDQSD